GSQLIPFAFDQFGDSAELHIKTIFATVLGLLLLASASGWLLQQRRPQLSLQDYWRRLRAWWLVTLAVLVMMAAPPPGGALLLALLVLQALRECRDALWSGPRRLLLLA